LETIQIVPCFNTTPIMALSFDMLLLLAYHIFSVLRKNPSNKELFLPMKQIVLHHILEVSMNVVASVFTQQYSQSSFDYVPVDQYLKVLLPFLELTLWAIILVKDHQSDAIIATLMTGR
jgi:hypothetical protein